ncbi:class I SAM-dependent methyltransferase [bacterium]|nr:class I SAM-dependent methyltransferase [bacterium]
MKNTEKDTTPSPDPSAPIEYEDYNSTSGNYDDTRVPIGLPIVLDLLASTTTPLKEQSILDAGCGTGTFLAGLQGRVGTIHGRELSEGMQQVAKERFANDPNVQIDQGSITELPHADESFDAIVCNQVLHHLDHGEGEGASADDFPNVESFFREAFRVLRPNGIVVINTSDHDQHRDGFWWAALIPAAIERMLRRFPSIETLEEISKRTGFVDSEIKVPFDEVLQGKNYLDPKGPLSAAWRAGDSTWSLVTGEELTHALDRVTSSLKDGSMAAFLEEREELRTKIGQTTFLAVRKP